jgi:hypothetical protein
MNLTQRNNLKITIIILILMALFLWIGIRNNPDNIHHPDNQPFVLEVAFNEGIDTTEITQEQFNERYLK